MNYRFFLPFLGYSLCLASASYATAIVKEPTPSTLDLIKVFQGAPLIYSALLALSVFSFILWLYSMLTLKKSDMAPSQCVSKLHQQLKDQRFEAALQTCKEDPNFITQVIATGIQSRQNGPQMILESIHSEAKRSTHSLWQRVSLLNDVAVIAPMLGLLGTVVGMFYAFYDTQRTEESILAIFDGLGVAIGTTVAGLIVAILAMVFQTTLKLHIVRLLNYLEHESLLLANLLTIKSQTDHEG